MADHVLYQGHGRRIEARPGTMDKLQYYVNSFGDRNLYDVNRSLFNQVGADNIFRRRFGDRLFDKDSLTVVIGTDSGLLPRYIQQQGVPDGSRYLFIELDQLLPTIDDAVTGLDEHIHLVGQSGLIDALKPVNFADYANIGAVRLIESLGATDAFIGDYRDLVADIRRQLDGVLWAHGVQLSNPSFVRRQLEDLIEHHVPAQVLRNTFSGKTAALLGGGPSLDDMIPWIREHQQALVIIAVSRICRRLRDAGITPHIVVSIDPTEFSFDISKEFLDLDPKVVLAHANHVAFPLLAQWHGRSVFLDRRYPWVSKEEADNISAAGPTVTNTGFALAMAMGFGTIVFAGIDLCHSVEGYTHARGSNEFDAGPKLGVASMRVTTNSGRMAETTADFYNAISSFSAQARSAGQLGVRVINPSAGAAVMDAVEHIPLEQLQFAACEKDPFELLHACIDGDSPAQRLRNYAAMQRELARAHGRLRKIISLAEEALRCNDGLFGRAGKAADFRHKGRMDKIERQLDNKLNDLSSIVRMFSAQAFLHMPPSDREWTDDEIEQAGKTYYSAYRNNAQQILELVEQAQHRVGSAIAEDSEKPDFDRLFAQWESDHIPGRARVWRHRHPQAAAQLPPALARRFDALDEDFRAIMQTRETSHAKKVRAETALGPVRGKLQVLFKERNVEELSNAAEQLSRQEGAEASQLRMLATGYLAELAGDAEAAFDHYGALIELVREDLDTGATDEPNPRLEDALRRMAVIAMSQQQHEQALLILETLAGFSPAYSQQYAELLRLSGDTQAAADVYTNYLTKAPGDLAAMLRLGRLYQTMGVDDAARTAFSYVLEKDPDNKAAMALLQQSETAA